MKGASARNSLEKTIISHLCEAQHHSHPANHFQKHIWINHRGLCAHSHSWESWMRSGSASTHAGAALCPPFPHLSTLAPGGMGSLGHRLMEGAARARQEASGSGAVSCTQLHPAAAPQLQTNTLHSAFAPPALGQHSRVSFPKCCDYYFMGRQLEARLGEVGLLFRLTAQETWEGRKTLGSIQKPGIEDGVSSPLLLVPHHGGQKSSSGLERG